MKPITSSETGASGAGTGAGSGAESEARAAAADDAGKPIEVSFVDEPGAGAGPQQVPIDVAAMHGLLVKMIRGAVLRIDASMKWTEHPNDEWYESTTTVCEILLEKYLGLIATSPEVLLMFNVTVVWMLPNVLNSMAAAEAKAAEAKARKESAAAPAATPAAA